MDTDQAIAIVTQHLLKSRENLDLETLQAIFLLIAATRSSCYLRQCLLAHPL